MGDYEPSILELMESAGQEPPRVRLPPTAGESDVGDEGTPVGRTGRYEILGPLAEGGVGQVLRGRDLDLGRDVAIKVLHAKHRDDPDLVQRFLDEGQIGGQLQHPGIVPVYEIGVDAKQRPFLAMKLVKGKTLAARLDERPTPTVGRRRFLRFFDQLTQAVAYAHARGVVHRDLKPSNVMVGTFGEVQLLDWGFAKVLRRGGLADEHRGSTREDDLTRITAVHASDAASVAASVTGTPAYMPPEQALGEIDGLDERCDVFSLGAILCEILTGAPPYVGSREQLAALAAQAKLDDAHARLDACGAEAGLVALCRSCLEPLRADRPRDASFVAETLHDHLLATEERARQARIAAVEARAAAAVAETEADHERRGRRQTLLVAASVFVLLGVGLAAAWGLQQEARAQATRATGAVTAAMQEAERLRGEGRLAEALAAAERAEALAVKGDGAGELRPAAAKLVGLVRTVRDAAEARSAQAEKDAVMVRTLREIRSRQTKVEDSYAHTDAQVVSFEKAFRDYGLDMIAADPEEVAEHIRSSSIRQDLVGGLAFWAQARKFQFEGKEPGWERLVRIVDLADPDPWMVRVRRALFQSDVAALERAIEERRDEELPSNALLTMVSALGVLGEQERKVDLLEAHLVKHPEDLMAHQMLAVVGLVAARPKLARRHGLVRIALDPDSRSARVTLANSLAADGDFEAAIGWFQRAMEATPDRLEDVRRMVDLHRQNGSLTEALEGWTQKLATRPEDPQLLALVGCARTNLGDAQGALEPLARLAQLRPDAPHAAGLLGSAYGFAGQVDKALACWAKASRLQPLSFMWTHMMGQTLGSTREHASLSEVRDRFERLLPEASGIARCSFFLAYADVRSRLDAADAVSACAEAAVAFPESLGPHLQASKLLDGQLQDLAGARRSAQRAVELAPGMAEPHYLLGIAALKSGDWDLAEREIRAALRRNATDGPTRMAFVWIHALQHRESECVTFFQERVARHPTPRDRAYLGIALLRASRLSEATDVLRTLWRERPGDPLAAYWLGACLFEAGELEEACRVLEHAVRAKPLEGGPRNLLAVLLLRRGKPEDARRVFLEGLALRTSLMPYAERAVAYLAACCSEPPEAQRWCEANFPALNSYARTHIHSGIAEALLAHGRLPEAIARFEQALATIGGRYPSLQHMACKAYLLRGDLEKAEQVAPRAAWSTCDREDATAWERGHFAAALKAISTWRAYRVDSTWCSSYDDPVGKTRARLRYYDLLEPWAQRLVALRPQAAAIQAGTYEPRTAREALDAAEFARCAGAHAEAAAYFVRGVDETLPEVSNRFVRVRFRAARAAVLAAAADGTDADERTRLHERARTWLRDELVHWRKRMSERKPQGRLNPFTFFEPQLWEWKFHVDFESVTEPQALERLPAAEHEAWTTFWAEVDEVLRIGSR